jgi:hypothetical protein
MADLKQCDICKKIITKHLHVIQVYERHLPDSWHNNAGRIQIEICRDCLKRGFMLIYSDWRKYQAI